MNKKVKLGVIAGILASTVAGISAILKHKKKRKFIETEVKKVREADIIISSLNEAYFPEGERLIAIVPYEEYDCYIEELTEDEAKLLDDTKSFLALRGLFNTGSEKVVLINTEED